jgi:hypothetical protein
MKCPCKHQEVICRKLLQPSVKFSLVYEAAGLVDDDQRVDDPNRG